MHYIDLLNYLIDVQKIEKEELCELLAIPKKKLDSVLTGTTPLKKKCLKNLSLYTSIPLDSINSGNFVLNIPQVEVAEGEEAPKIIKDAYVPEYIREANTNRLKAYCKKRYKNRRDDVLGLLIVQILFSVISIITSLFLVYNLNIIGYKSSLAVFAVGILPAILGLIIGINCYKYAWKGTVKSEKHFTFYTILYIIQLLSYTIALVVSKWTSPLSIVFAIIAVLPVIYTVYIEKRDRMNYIKSLLIGIISMLSVGGIFILLASSEYLNNVEDDRILAVAGILSFIGFLILSISASNLIVSFTFNRKRNNLAKHFEPVNKKNIFNGNRVFKNILVILLLTAILTSFMYVLPIVGYKNYMDVLIGADVNLYNRYHDYDKQDIIFTEADKYYVIENEIYSIKVPDKLVMSSDTESSTIYNNNDTTLSIIINKKFIDVEGIIDNAHQNIEMPLNLNLKQEIKERYGFFPKSDYENNKLMRMIYNDDISVLDRRLTIATYYFRASDSIMMNNSEIYLFEDEKITLSVQASSYKRDDGKTAYFYTVSGNAVGNYDKFFDFTLFTVTDGEEDDIAYKIINSIEFK